MNYAEIKYNDIANGPGVRTSIFVSGCTHHCKGCFNEVAWDFNYGKEFDQHVQDVLIEESNSPFIQGFTFLGGEPMEVANQKALRPFIERIRKELPDKVILTGGISNSTYFTRILSEKIGRTVEPTEDGRYAGALGAALLAEEKSRKKRQTVKG